MNNKNVVYSELIRKLNAIHIVSECLSNTERDVYESKKIRRMIYALIWQI